MSSKSSHSIKVADNRSGTRSTMNEWMNEPGLVSSNKVMHLLFSPQTLGWRDYWSCWYSSGSGTESQCGSERTNEEDAFWSVQDVKSSFTLYRCKPHNMYCRYSRFCLFYFSPLCNKQKNTHYRKWKPRSLVYFMLLDISTVTFVP